jgi:hypothetical protein
MSQKFYIFVLLTLIFSCKTYTESTELEVKWKQTSDSMFVFKLGDLEVKIDALHAGKIASVRLDQNEFLILTIGEIVCGLVHKAYGGGLPLNSLTNWPIKF